MKSTIGAILAMTICWATASYSTGSIRGSIKSADSGEPLPMSLIFVYSADTKAPARMFHSETGTFTIVEVPPGVYQAIAWHHGFESVLVQVEVKGDSAVVLDFLMRPVRSRPDSTDVVRPGKPDVDYKMKFYKPKMEGLR
jgi:hypothetical protein